ncbi:MAG: hypothetical protein K2I30_07155 [Clostridia bacterium]|nr:hypothetical protein [Clostridia bacterium]
MPNKLNQENLEKIQLLIDADKYKNSIISGFDLCGIFAPFCRGCDKTSIYPCAVSYIRMLQSQGMDIEIDASPSNAFEAPKYAPQINIPRTKPQPRTATAPVQYDKKQQRPKPYERKPSETKYPAVKPVDQKSYEPKVNERNVADKKTAYKPAEIFLPDLSVAEIAVAQTEPLPKTMASIPMTEEIKMEEKFVQPTETVETNYEKEYQSSDGYTAETAKNETTVSDKSQTSQGTEKRKLRIAVARRKL